MKKQPNLRPNATAAKRNYQNFVVRRKAETLFNGITANRFFWVFKTNEKLGIVFTDNGIPDLNFLSASTIKTFMNAINKVEANL